MKPEAIDSIKKDREKRREKELEFYASKKLNAIAAKEEKKKL